MSKVTVFTKYKSGQKTRWAIVFGQNVNWKRLQVLDNETAKKSRTWSCNVAVLVAVFQSYRVGAKNEDIL